jgi:hypothetical protein
MQQRERSKEQRPALVGQSGSECVRIDIGGLAEQPISQSANQPVYSCPASIVMDEHDDEAGVLAWLNDAEEAGHVLHDSCCDRAMVTCA